MNRRMFTYALTTTAVAVLAVGGIFLAMTGKTAGASAANVVHGGSCTISLDPIGGGMVAADESHEVVTSSGNSQLKCQGKIPPELLPSKSVIIRGLGCQTANGFAPDSVNHYTPGGQAALICNINPGRE